MAIREITQYMASDGTLFNTSQLEKAQDYQDNLNLKAEREWNQEALNSFVKKAIDVANDPNVPVEQKKGQIIIKNIFTGKVSTVDSDNVLTEYFVDYGRDLMGLLGETSHNSGGRFPVKGESAVIEMRRIA